MRFFYRPDDLPVVQPTVSKHSGKSPSNRGTNVTFNIVQISNRYTGTCPFYGHFPGLPRANGGLHVSTEISGTAEILCFIKSNVLPDANERYQGTLSIVTAIFQVDLG